MYLIRTPLRTDFRPATRCRLHSVGLRIFLAMLIGVSVNPWQGLLSGQKNFDRVYTDSQGILHSSSDSTELTGFGINYTVPFAHAYRQAKNKGVDLKKAIDQDVHQFARLGLDLFRVHVWDCEISDTLGNLLDNEHLELFDYLLFRLQENNIRAVLTPIAYWGNGWPEPDEKTPGFSTKYGKDSCLVDLNAIAAQANYLSQFVNHINPYTGKPYKNDPMILAFEISNEPHHKGSPDEVTAFVKTMVDAIQSAGCKKPVFYNVSHRVHLAEAYYKGGIDGGTFQWYPTGLGFRKELGGNLLPNVDHYAIPFDSVMNEYHSARFVYEFDAADMASTYMYPAIARSFRSAGMQMATHFSYDPTFLAPYNTEYNTHFMNLIYAPRKALSLMISAEVFRHIPLYTEYGNYPDNTSFGPFHISYEQDLAEMVNEEKFIYTNHTTTSPPAPQNLQLIAGWGNSPLVSYEGTGAYFLDKVGNGLWNLEVLPDRVLVDNLFGWNSPDKILAALLFQEWPMKVHLPDLERGFVVMNMKTQEFLDVNDHEFIVEPGRYILMSVDFSKMELELYNFPTNHSIASSCTDQVHPTISKKYVLHTPSPEATLGKSISIQAMIASPTFPDSVELWLFKDNQPKSIRMDRVHGYDYSATIPGDWLQGDSLKYWITTYYGLTPQTYPGETVSKPDEYGFVQSVSYKTILVTSRQGITLFDAGQHSDRINRVWLPGSEIKENGENHEKYLSFPIQRLTRIDPENPNGPAISDYSVRHYFGDLVKGRTADLISKKKLVVDAHSGTSETRPVLVALVMKDGSAFGATVKLKPKKGTHSIQLKKLKKVNAVILPRPYPTFLPYYSKAGKAVTLDMSQVESLQISVGPGLKPNQVNVPFTLMLGRVWLE